MRHVQFKISEILMKANKWNKNLNFHLVIENKNADSAKLTCCFQSKSYIYISPQNIYYFIFSYRNHSSLALHLRTNNPERYQYKNTLPQHHNVPSVPCHPNRHWPAHPKIFSKGCSSIQKATCTHLHHPAYCHHCLGCHRQHLHILHAQLANDRGCQSQRLDWFLGWLASLHSFPFLIQRHSCSVRRDGNPEQWNCFRFVELLFAEAGLRHGSCGPCGRIHDHAYTFIPRFLLPEN